MAQPHRAIPRVDLNINTAEVPRAEVVEKSVLASILVNGSLIDKVIKDFSSELFYDYKNKAISKAIMHLYKDNNAIDLVSVTTELSRTEKLTEAGGAAYISNLTTFVVNYEKIDYHIRVLQQESLRRNLIRIGAQAVNKSFDPMQDVFDAFNEVQNDLDNAIKRVVNYEIKKVGDVHTEILKESLEVLNSGKKSGVPSGLRLLDNLTNGWQNSDFIIVAGRPGMGKTSFVVSVAMNPAIEQNIPVAIFSLEMSSAQVVSRMQSAVSGVNVSKIVKKQLSNDEILQIDTMSKGLKNAPIFIDDTPAISLLELKGKCRKLQKEHGVKLIVIDYLQLMKSGVKTQSRELEISEISRGLKSLAKELNIPVIALSQLSRAVEQRGGDKKPQLSDLRESGSLEMDTDMVMFCYRPEYYSFDEYEVGNETFDSKGLFMLLVAKHRNGEVGEIPLKFLHEQTKVTNWDSKNWNNFNKIPEKNVKPIENNDTFVPQNNGSVSNLKDFNDDFFKPDGTEYPF
jgi:replicative DNA helicase